MYICNAFSLQMLPGNRVVDLRVTPVSIEDVKTLELESAIGHQDTAAVLSGILERNIRTERINVKLEEGDEIIVAQVQGGRLPEGCTTLPEGIQIAFLKVTVAVAF